MLEKEYNKHIIIQSSNLEQHSEEHFALLLVCQWLTKYEHNPADVVCQRLLYCFYGNLWHHFVELCDSYSSLNLR